MSFFSKRKEPQGPSEAQLLDIKSRNVLDSIKASVAFIEFEPNGTIIEANDNFLAAVGYQLSEIQGKHHKIFCESAYTNSSEYRDFWRKLSSGQALVDRFLRVTKTGSLIWLEASYNPVKDDDDNIISIVKIATDVTEHVNKADIQNGILQALDRSTAIISFELNGTVIDANENFTQTVGYSLSQIQGENHRMFCSAELISSLEYKQFWAKLNSGEFVQGLFERQTSNGDSIWLEASYNPIKNDRGELLRIVKFANDVTSRVNSLNNASEAVHATVIETEQVSEQAKSVLQNTVTIMDEISTDVEVLTNNISDLTEQSTQISEMVNTISSIAAQTNLLALNAAIEAARAGTQGRGFAVVADEVRQLAARTSTSTAEISIVVKNNQSISTALSENIISTQQKAKSGTELISQVDGIFREINLGMQSVTSAVEGLSE